MTSVGIPFSPMSHPLSDQVRLDLQGLASAVEETLQAETHTVGSAIAENRAFDKAWIESHLTRAVIAHAARAATGGRLGCEELANGGIEIISVEGNVERRFRLRKADLDRDGQPRIRVNTDSLLNVARPAPTLFDDPVDVPPEHMERWVIGYLLNPSTRTFAEVFAARVMGTIGEQPPYRLALADILPLPHTAPLPPEFRPDQDDLDFPDEEEGLGDEAE